MYLSDVVFESPKFKNYEDKISFKNYEDKISFKNYEDEISFTAYSQTQSCQPSQMIKMEMSHYLKKQKISIFSHF